MIAISACIVGFLAGAGTGLIIMSILTAGSRAAAWRNGYDAGAAAQRVVTNVLAIRHEAMRHQRAGCGSLEDR